MQNHPPSNNGSDGTPASAQNEQNPVSQNASQAYVEPTYQEYASGGGGGQQSSAPNIASPTPPLTYANAFGAPPVSQPGYPPPTPQPGYIPPTPPPGYIPQAAYGPPIQQPGYLPPTPQPGYSAQPGYIAPTPQPGYMPPGPRSPMPQAVPQRRRLSGLAITGLIVAAVV